MNDYYQQPMYQPVYQQPPLMDNLMQMRSQQPKQAAPQSGMIWVQGEAAAKSYLVAAGNTVPLWDSESQCIYLKSVDQSGMPSMRILDYKERAAAPAVSPTEYVTRKEYDDLAAKVAALMPKEVIDNG